MKLTHIIAFILTLVNIMMCISYAAAAKPMPALVFGFMAIALWFAIETDGEENDPY